MTDTTEVHSEFSQFDHVTSNHQGKHELFLTDPVFCNPNSSLSVARVLRKIGAENDIIRYGGRKRHWTFICCDGLPYMIIRKLKQEAVICVFADCNKSFLTLEEYNKHANQSNPDEQRKYVLEFDWLYLKIGLGHYEMNLIKSFFELNWVPFLEAMCEEMGFESDASKLFAKRCKDHHKSWRLLLIFHLGSLQELVLPYVRHCLLLKSTPSAKGFLGFNARFYSSKEYPNLTYLMDQVGKYSQGIINLRMATRRNNASLLRSSMYMTKELFHGRQHPKYQIIELYDAIQYKMMPEDVRQLYDDYSSITTSGNYSLGEDFDFVLEEKNKQLKSWIPKGVPTDEIWQTVCRNNTLLENIKDRSLSVLGLSSSKSGTHSLGIDDAVLAFRVLLRKTNYLSKPTDHTSISGMALDEGLIGFTQAALGKRIHIIKTEFLGLPLQPEHYIFRHPVPVTPFEREKLYNTSNMTINEIQEEILKILSQITDPFQFDYDKKLYQQEVKTKGKARLIHFLQEVKTALHTDNTVDFDNEMNQQ
ncbi:unnamed protein product [Mytilus coruscus]|uniref:Uncharacterized protein n=1 Tax=Mytilus coruscus TaxID=42192 RepID=A0A6J8EQ16_MYTCO|nr:unnamed protein product [Mytilus coruscus]